MTLTAASPFWHRALARRRDRLDRGSRHQAARPEALGDDDADRRFTVLASRPGKHIETASIEDPDTTRQDPGALGDDDADRRLAVLASRPRQAHRDRLDRGSRHHAARPEALGDDDADRRLAVLASRPGKHIETASIEDPDITRQDLKLSETMTLTAASPFWHRVPARRRNRLDRGSRYHAARP